MNRLKQILCSKFMLFLCFVTIGAYGQKQTKTFKETFTVAEDAVLDININHADIEFETWSKNQVVVEATIEVEGVGDDERDDFFKNAGVEISGNSKKVQIYTEGENIWFVQNSISDVQDFHFEIPELPEMELFFDELNDLPSLSINPTIAFDYEAFNKDGQNYLEKWQKEYEKAFGKEHMKTLEVWLKQIEKRQKDLEKRTDKIKSMRESHSESRSEAHAARAQKIGKLKADRARSYKERRKQIKKIQTDMEGELDSASFIILNNNEPTVFYSAGKGVHSNSKYKIKKTIKVKMPKTMKIKMNVRYGEVKLAANTKNIQADLSHASLWGSSIVGEETSIKAYYSPVNVKNWQYGYLQTNYSDNVVLNTALNLRLNAVSSDVTINELRRGAYIKNELGAVQINLVNDDFDEIDISLQNAEFTCKTPSIPFTIYANRTASELSYPDAISLHDTKNGNTIISKGYAGNEAAKKSFVIHSKYSSIVLE